MSDTTSFNEIRELEESKRKLERAKGSRRYHAIASSSAYFVGIVAISVLSLIFAQTVSSIFEDSILKFIGSAGAIAVGASAVVFLLFNDKILHSEEQFIAAKRFVTVEMVLLSLGSMYAFGSALKWQFAPFVVELTHIAVIVTLPVVGVEWIYVVGVLNPKAKAKRDENFSESKRQEDDRAIRDNYLNSDEIIRLRKASIMAEVIEEEMARLPTEMRGTYAKLLEERGLGNVPVVNKHLPDVLDMPRTYPAQAPMHTFNSDGNGQSPKR